MRFFTSLLLFRNRERNFKKRTKKFRLSLSLLFTLYIDRFVPYSLAVKQKITLYYLKDFKRIMREYAFFHFTSSFQKSKEILKNALKNSVPSLKNK
mgnify:CR=1 FL=1